MWGWSGGGRLLPWIGSALFSLLLRAKNDGVGHEKHMTIWVLMTKADGAVISMSRQSATDAEKEISYRYCRNRSITSSNQQVCTSDCNLGGADLVRFVRHDGDPTLDQQIFHSISPSSRITAAPNHLQILIWELALLIFAKSRPI